MTDGETIGHLYAGWSLLNDELAGLAERASEKDLAMQASPEQWPIWATLAHVAGVRIYWLCRVVGEPEPPGVPPVSPGGSGWEDHPEHVRDGMELAGALRASWMAIDGCLGRWTPAMLDEDVVRKRSDGVRQLHTRQSILFRLLTHDAFHAGEISQLLGTRGLAALDPWAKLHRPAP